MLNHDNYYSAGNNMEYMGSTQFKAFQRCEAAALAELTGEYEREMTPALLVGSYVDAHFEGTLDQFKENHPEIFLRSGGLKSDFVQAEQVIARIERDRLMSLLLSGEKQAIRTGEIAGVPFKIKIDSLLSADTCRTIMEEFPMSADFFGFGDGALVDLKVIRDFQPLWSNAEHEKISFVLFWGYDTQGAIYQAVEGNYLPFFIAAGTKEREPDISALWLPPDVLEMALFTVQEIAPRYQAIKEGKVAPVRCEVCDYCRKTKVLTSIFDFRELELI